MGKKKEENINNKNGVSRKLHCRIVFSVNNENCEIVQGECDTANICATRSQTRERPRVEPRVRVISSVITDMKAYI